MSKHSQDVPAPSRVGADFGPEAEPSAGCSGATPRAADSLRELHLFAGAGGGILGGMLLGHTPVCAVELDAYCRKVLQARQADGWLPQFPIYEDVRKFDGTAWRGRVDVVGRTRRTLARPSRAGLPSPASSLRRCVRCWRAAHPQAVVALGRLRRAATADQITIGSTAKRQGATT